MYKFLIIQLLAWISFTSGMYAQTSFSTKEKDIYHLLELTGVTENVNLMVDRTLAYLKQQKPNVPDDIWLSIKEELKYEKYTNRLVQVYSIHYSQTELTELITFFESPIGQKYIQKAEVIGQENYAIGKELGREIGVMINEKLKQSGY